MSVRKLVALPATFPRDHADRLIVALAIVRGATPLTKEQRIVASRLVHTLV